MNKKIFGGIFLLLLIGGIFFLLTLKSDKNQFNVDLSEVEKSVSIEHFDDAFFTTDTLNFKSDFNSLGQTYFPFFQSNPEINFWYSQRLDPSQNNLYADWKKIMQHYDDLDNQLIQAFKHLYHYYPQLPEFKLYTYISNLDFDYPIILADNLVFVATDMYLGKNHPAYKNESSYLNYNRQAEFLATDVTAQFAQNFVNKDLDDNTLLNEMIYWGKVTYFNKAMQPAINDTAIVKMSLPQLKFCLSNEINIWTYFIDNQLLFSTNDEVKRKFIAPAPFSKFGMSFDSESPGMIGRWIGYRIVLSYMANNPNVSLPQFMANKDNKSIFKNSKYKP